ncbi:MAG: glycosyltransferase family 2 protein [Candidatus Omnitrophota bacterium]
MTRPKISVAIITKNEERNIRECIARVAGWAFEVIVVDGYSADRTRDIAAECGARVIPHRFEGDFSKERNAGMDASSGDWVLHLDADDRVTDDFKKKADEAVGSDDAVDVYKFRRKNFFLGHCMEHGGWCHYIPNLVRRRAVRFEGALHERPVYKGKTGTIEADIEHYPFTSISQFIERQNHYSSVEAEALFKREGASMMDRATANMVGRTFKIFWKMYVKKKGYREGMYGLVFSVLFAFVNFLIWAKYRELCAKKDAT